MPDEGGGSSGEQGGRGVLHKRLSDLFRIVADGEELSFGHSMLRAGREAEKETADRPREGSRILKVVQKVAEERGRTAACPVLQLVRVRVKRGFDESVDV